MKFKNTLLSRLFTGIFLIGALSFGFTSCGGGDEKENGEEHQEHPEGEEHPDEGEEHPDEEGEEHPDEGEEHPDEEDEEHPDEEADKGEPLTIEQFADAATSYIEEKSKKNGGTFPVKDKEQDKTLKLELEKVHRKRLSHLGDNTYFVCADFKAQDGKTYDVDIFMTGTSKDDLAEAKKPKVHKVEGEARFTYIEENGVWKRKKKG